MASAGTFDELGLPGPLREAIAARGLTAPTRVQTLVRDSNLAGRDTLVSSQTGSGKTLAFGFLLADALVKSDETVERGKLPVGLVLAPTRELAVQIRRELEWLFEKTAARVVSVTGGADARAEQRQLSRGCEILVATPGRLVDHLQRKNADLSALRVVVLDEGDEMLDMGFREELEKILGAAPKERQTHLFSATIPPGIKSLAREWMKDAAVISAGDGAKGTPNADIEFHAHLYGHGQREAAVTNVLLRYDAPAAIVFTRTRAGTAELGTELLRRGFAAVTISGDLSQSERTRALTALREGRSRVLVATDVAARGLDLPDVGLVVHADPPAEASALTHRSGRTGRAGKKGVSVVLAPRGLRAKTELLFRAAKISGQWTPLPSAAEIAQASRDRFVEALKAEAAEPEGDDAVFVDMLLDAIPVRELVSALVARARASMPTPAEVAAVAPEARRPRGEGAPERGPRGEGSPDRRPHARPAQAGYVAFRVNIGREFGAEPRRLLPMICRRGGVDGKDVGKIDIRPRSTTFEIRQEAAEKFEKNASRRDPAEPKV
ncbi:MAG TPA: DEAD/DEAH box helicase, partial [bacterium]|nr:DEAD/DEAH box helicase [bacterium]